MNHFIWVNKQYFSYKCQDKKTMRSLFLFRTVIPYTEFHKPFWNRENTIFCKQHIFKFLEFKTPLKGETWKLYDKSGMDTNDNQYQQNDYNYSRQ
jgi:hypothetical protein